MEKGGKHLNNIFGVSVLICLEAVHKASYIDIIDTHCSISSSMCVISFFSKSKLLMSCTLLSSPVVHLFKLPPSCVAD